MNDLERYFDANEGRRIHKWKHYFEVYDRHFSRFRNTDVHVLEFGVSHGGSLQMWQDYFGPEAKIFGADINPHCKQFEEGNVRIFIGDQEDRGFLRHVGNEVGRIDILIDDGGHTMAQQINTFEELFPLVDENGVYLCEDLNTSYKKKWGGGYRKKGTFIEYSKDFIDKLNAWHSSEPHRLEVDEFTRSTDSLHYYDGILVIEKRPRSEPFHIKSGQEQIPNYHTPKGPIKRLEQKLRRMLKGKG
ncbi:MAG: class I SAM-dependent methyltransferase [Pseudomonadales bacterium]|nr:class I SAM-dependent methyltransferase [Pseudomonadales bacterium]